MTTTTPTPAPASAGQAAPALPAVGEVLPVESRTGRGISLLHDATIEKAAREVESAGGDSADYDASRVRALKVMDEQKEAPARPGYCRTCGALDFCTASCEAGNALAGQPAEGAGQAVIEIAARIFDFKPHKQTEETKAKYLRFAAAILARGAGQAGQVAKHCQYPNCGCTSRATCNFNYDATERAAAPAEHKRVIEFALELAEHENDDAAVSFLKAWNSEDAGYLHANWPDFA